MTHRAARSGAGRPRSTRSTEYSAQDRAERNRQPADPDGLARALCLRQLEARSRTRVELERYLARELVPEESCARVLDRLTEVGLIDDESLARAFATSRHAEQGLARRAIAVKLKQRGVADDVIGTAVAGVDSDDEVLAARRLVAKKLPAVAKLDRTVAVRRLVGLLGRKGYPSGLAYRLVNEALTDLGDAGGEQYS